MKIAIGSDHGGYRLKEEIIKVVEQLGHEVTDFGCTCADSVDYPDYALEVCNQVVAGKADRGRFRAGRGKSELHRAGCRVTPGRRKAMDSATEKRPPMALRGHRQG